VLKSAQSAKSSRRKKERNSSRGGCRIAGRRNAARKTAENAKLGGIY